MTRTGLNIHRTAKPVTSHLRGPILPMRQEDEIAWRLTRERHPKWYGRK